MGEAEAEDGGVGGRSKGDEALKSRMACAVVRSSGFRSNNVEQTLWSLNFSCSTATIDSGRQ